MSFDEINDYCKSKNVTYIELNSLNGFNFNALSDLIAYRLG